MKNNSSKSFITGSSGSTQNTSPSWTWGDRSGSSLNSILYAILSRKDKTGSSQVQLGLVFKVDPIDPVINLQTAKEESRSNLKQNDKFRRNTEKEKRS